MKSDIKKSLAESLETDIDLLPYMPYLLQDMWELGCSAELILEGVNSLALPSHSKVLDLGCGKGALSIQIAAQFGFEAVGIDAMEEFLRVAKEKSAKYKVDNLCQFVNQDMRDYVKVPHDFDVVILAAVGGVFGSWQETIANLRTQVKNGGFIFIDDGYLKDRISFNRRGYSHYCDHESSITALTIFGDILIEEIDTTALSIDLSNQYMKGIAKRGQELIEQNPQLVEKINWYIRNQLEECDIIENEITGALWVLKKSH